MSRRRHARRKALQRARRAHHTPGVLRTPILVPYRTVLRLPVGSCVYISGAPESKSYVKQADGTWANEVPSYPGPPNLEQQCEIRQLMLYRVGP